MKTWKLLAIAGRMEDVVAYDSDIGDGFDYGDGLGDGHGTSGEDGFGSGDFNFKGTGRGAGYTAGHKISRVLYEVKT